VIAEVGTSVIADPARIANGAAVPRGTGGCAAAALLASASATSTTSKNRPIAGQEREPVALDRYL
jgi:hypothetical protein